MARSPVPEHRIPEPFAAVRFVAGRAEYAPGSWVAARTGRDGALRLAWRVTAPEAGEEGPVRHEVALTRTGADAPTADDVEVIMRGIPRGLEVAGQETRPGRRALVITLVQAQRAML